MKECQIFVKVSHVDPNPQEEKEDPKAKEEGGNQAEWELLLQIPGVLVGRDFVDKKPCHEEKPNAEQDHSQVWIN